MSTYNKKKNRTETLDKRDSKKFFTVVGIAVGLLMVLLFFMFRKMG